MRSDDFRVTPQKVVLNNRKSGSNKAAQLFYKERNNKKDKQGECNKCLKVKYQRPSLQITRRNAAINAYEYVARKLFIDRHAGIVNGKIHPTLQIVDYLNVVQGLQHFCAISTTWRSRSIRYKSTNLISIMLNTITIINSYYTRL